MALKYSNMLPLGTKMPDFELKNVLDDKVYTSSALMNANPSLIMVICNHCPYVVQYHSEIKRLESDFADNIDFVAISSNDIISYPEDGPIEMKKLFYDLKLSFPYLLDETQEIAKKLKAECTPEFYLYDRDNLLVYRGRMDDSSPGNDINPSAKYLRKAMTSLLNGEGISADQQPSMGCSIKWK